MMAGLKDRKVRFPWDDEDWVWPLTFKQGAAVTIIIISVIAAGMGILLGGKSAYVSGTSMYPTLNDGDMLYGIRRPDMSLIHRGSIIVFHDSGGWSDKNRNLVKRVVAVPGDTVGIDDDGRISVNGKLISGEGSYTVGPGSGADTEVTIPAGMYWVRGDNINVSNDSRRIYCYHKGKPYLVRADDIVLLATKDIDSIPFRRI